MGEECDDGSFDNGDGCSQYCKREVCRDGIVQPREECDDGNSRGFDGCSSTCGREVCGDGIVQPGEDVDLS
jgi:cysteine-rich repeat protein